MHPSIHPCYFTRTMTYTAAIFDLDGTLLNTLEDIADSCNRVLTQAGFPTHPVPAYKDFVGRGIRHLIKVSVPEDSVTDELIEALTAKMNADYSKHCTDKTAPYPGIIETLTELDARGIIMSILSNKPQPMVEQTVRKFLPYSLFKTVMGTTSHFPKKPDPQSTLYIVEQMKTSKQNTVFIGDSEIDILTAQNTGISSITVAWGFRPVDILASTGADIILHDPVEILTFFPK